jgi:hypothetical protein
MAVLVAQRAAAGYVAAGRVDPPSEFGQGRIDAAVDNRNFYAFAGRAVLPGGNRA